MSFRPLAEADLPTVAAWLQEPHVQAWWRDPSTLADVEARYGPAIRGVDPTDMFVIVHEARDVGLAQSYRVADHPDWAQAIAGSGLTFPAAAGIDYLIGEPGLVGRGVGTAMIATFTPTVFERYPDVDCIVVIPQAGNLASCRVLEKAGYERRWTGMLDSDDPSDADLAALYVLER